MLASSITRVGEVLVCIVVRLSEFDINLLANCDDPDQTAPEEQSDLGHHSLLWGLLYKYLG